MALTCLVLVIYAPMLSACSTATMGQKDAVPSTGARSDTNTALPAAQVRRSISAGATPCAKRWILMVWRFAATEKICNFNENLDRMRATASRRSGLYHECRCWVEGGFSSA